MQDVKTYIKTSMQAKLSTLARRLYPWSIMVHLFVSFFQLSIMRIGVVSRLLNGFNEWDEEEIKKRTITGSLRTYRSEITKLLVLIEPATVQQQVYFWINDYHLYLSCSGFIKETLYARSIWILRHTWCTLSSHTLFQAHNWLSTGIIMLSSLFYW